MTNSDSPSITMMDKSISEMPTDFSVGGYVSEHFLTLHILGTKTWMTCAVLTRVDSGHRQVCT